MILASGEGQLIFLVVMAVIGVINWLSQKRHPVNKPAPPNPSRPDAASSRPADADSEEERMRRFLEALGLPADGRPAPAPPRVEQRPVPSPAARRPPVTPPPLQPKRRASARTPRPATDSRAEEFALPDQTIPSAPEFETLSSKITAAPMDFPATREGADRPHGPSMSETLRAALASPQQLRSAFILSEVFGTPPGLRQL